MRVLLLLILAGTYFCAEAQEYLPLPISGVEWSRLYNVPTDASNPNDSESEVLHYAPYGDTLIGETLYTQLYVSHGQYFKIDSARYVGAYFTEDAQTWFLADGAVIPYLLYDLSLRPGDVVDLDSGCNDTPDCPTYVVHSIDVIALEDGVSRRRMNIHQEKGEISYYAFSWIEGIGSTLGFFNELSCQEMTATEGDNQCSYRLLCFQQTGQTLYSDPQFYKGKCYLENATIGSTSNLSEAPIFNLFPNPVHDFLTIEMIGVSGVATQPYKIYAANGAVISFGTLEGNNVQLDISHLSSGIYTIILPQRGSISIGRFIKTR